MLLSKREPASRVMTTSDYSGNPSNHKTPAKSLMLLPKGNPDLRIHPTVLPAVPFSVPLPDTSLPPPTAHRLSHGASSFCEAGATSCGTSPALAAGSAQYPGARNGGLPRSRACEQWLDAPQPHGRTVAETFATCEVGLQEQRTQQKPRLNKREWMDWIWTSPS